MLEYKARHFDQTLREGVIAKITSNDPDQDGCKSELFRFNEKKKKWDVTLLTSNSPVVSVKPAHLTFISQSKHHEAASPVLGCTVILKNLPKRCVCVEGYNRDLSSHVLTHAHAHAQVGEVLPTGVQAHKFLPGVEDLGRQSIRIRRSPEGSLHPCAQQLASRCKQTKCGESLTCTFS